MLNAAVEAARAGDHGRGFAVVVFEVCNLAECSQRAAAKVSRLAADTISGTVLAGLKLRQMITDIERTSRLVSQISTASQELAIGAGQVNQAIVQLNQVTRENTPASEQVSSTAETLAAQAEALQTTTAFFRTATGAGGLSGLAAGSAERQISVTSKHDFAFDLELNRASTGSDLTGLSEPLPAGA